MNKNKSFTLIELLVVIVIIGILAGVIMISTSSSIDKANIAKIKVFEESVQNNLAANMVSRWPLDEIIGTAAPYKTPDQWGGNTGTLGDGTNATTYPTLLSESECVSGKCMKFDGGDYITVNDNSSLQLEEGLTLSVWAFYNGGTITPFRTLIGKPNYNDYGIILEGDGRFRGDFYANGLRHAIYMCDYINSPAWFYLTFTYDSFSGIYKTYFNSKLYSQATTTDGKVRISGSTFYIGGTPVSYFFPGKIDDVRIYNAALSSSQIRQNYIAGLNSMLANGNISKKDYNERINALAYEQE
ncbi:MAG: LamG-like jellyroll fold domain-containing protein [Minisyncoccales bacterium]